MIEKGRKSLLLTIVLLVFCLALAGLNFARSPEWSADFFEYQRDYDFIGHVQLHGFLDFFALSYEPAFVLASLLFSKVSDDVSLLLFSLALFSLLIKLVYFPRIYLGLPLTYAVVYALTYFILHELTSNRVAVATSLLLVSYHFLIAERRSLFFLFIGIASLFHYSAMIGVLAIVFAEDTSRIKNLCRHLFVASALYAFSIALKIDYFLDILAIVDAKKLSYVADLDGDAGSGFVRLTFVIAYQALIIFTCSLAGRDGASLASNRLHRVLLNLYILSISIYVILNGFGVVAVRLAEIFRNLEPLLLILTLSGCRASKKPFVWLVILVSILVNLHKNKGAIFPLKVFFESVGFA